MLGSIADRGIRISATPHLGPPAKIQSISIYETPRLTTIKYMYMYKLIHTLPTCKWDEVSLDGERM